MNIYTLISLVLLFLFVGCSSKEQIKTPKNIEDIKVNESISREDRVLVKEGESDFFQIYLSKDNEVKYICVNGNKECNYSNDKTNIVQIYKKSFYPNFSAQKRNIQCGLGSMSGFFILLSNDSINNYSKKNRYMCKNRFTKLDSTQVLTRVFTGVGTLGTSLLTSGTMHTVKFDEKIFKEVIVKSNLDNFQHQLFNISNINSFKSGLDVLYLDSNNVHESLKQYFDEILTQKHSREALVIVDKKNKHLLTIIDFRNYTSKDLVRNISSQIDDIFNTLNIKDENLIIKEEDIIKWIPRKVEKPIIPSVPTLQKDEFETKKEFRKKVLEAVKNRENRIKELQKKYNLDILKRNSYINTLQESYHSYLEEIYSENSELRKVLKKNSDLLVKILFIQNLNGIDAKDFKYDAEIKRLYFKLASNNDNLSLDVFSKIPASIAKRMKLESSFYIEPIIRYKKDFLFLKGYYIVDLVSKEKFNVIASDINFSPINQKVVIKSKIEEIKEDEKSKTFSSYKQNSSRIIESNKELWYIEMVDTLNAKVPVWFSNPKNLDATISFGSGLTYEEAKIKALNDLAIAREVKISSETEARIEFDNRFKKYNSIDRNVKTSTNMILRNDKYKVLKQEKIDGIWYISLKYISR